MSFFLKESIFNKDDYRSVNFKGNWSKHFINKYVDHLLNNPIELTETEFSNAKEEHLPNFLYKFFPPSANSLISLQNNTVFLSSPRNFNDPFDSYVGMEIETYSKLYLLRFMKENKLVSKIGTKTSLSKEEYWKIYHSWSKRDSSPPFGKKIYSCHTTLYEIKKNKDQYFAKLLDKLFYEGWNDGESKLVKVRNSFFKISCFSKFDNDDEVFNNTTMWSHYANNHKGFCVKYNINSSLQNINAIKCGLFPVTYTNRVSTISNFQLLKTKELNSLYDYNPAIFKAVFKAMILKSKYWKYEKEWRLIISEKNFDLLSDDSHEFFKIDSIFLGCRISRALRKLLVDYAESKEINVFELKESNEKFTLNGININSQNIRDQEYYEKLRYINDKFEGIDKEYKWVLLEKLSKNASG